MMRSCQRIGALLALLLFYAAPAGATIFGNLRGTVQDPRDRPIEGAEVTLRALASDWSRTAKTSAGGEFQFDAVPAGEYVITAATAKFVPMERRLQVASGAAQVLSFRLMITPLAQQVQVTASPQSSSPAATATQTVVSRAQIAQTPGADRSDSLAMITDYVPGAVIRADLLKIRGGEQVTWMVDGVEVPNHNVGINFAPQLDPKDIDYIEVKRGAYSAEYGGRTCGVFNVVPRSGFERNNEAELVFTYGNFNETNDQISLGSHTDRFAYYVSANANRTDLGLLTPDLPVFHDRGVGWGGFGSFIFNATPQDQLRLVTSMRRDYFQVPNTPEQQDAGIRDGDLENDAFVNFSWVKTLDTGTVLTVSPFYHFNSARYIGGPGDSPIIPLDDRASGFAGAQSDLAVVKGRNNLHFGAETYIQQDNTRFGVTANDGSGLSLQQLTRPQGNLQAAFIQEQYRLASWLTLNGGLRFTRYAGLFTETATDPRVGAAVRLPKLLWTLHGFYGRSYQPPPLNTVSGPLLQLALQNGFGFEPLHGERDGQYEFGLTVPVRDWEVDIVNFRNRVHNFFDHNVLGNSDITLPLTVDRALIRGWEATIHSPQIFRCIRLNMAYAHQHAEGYGGIVGGMTDFEPPEEGYFPLDHDQRDTLSMVASMALPGRFWAATTVAYGSGFLKGDGPDYLPPHTTFDISTGRRITENWLLTLAALNVANHRYLLDEGNSFEGTHFADPRRVSLELRYRFHY